MLQFISTNFIPLSLALGLGLTLGIRHRVGRLPVGPLRACLVIAVLLTFEQYFEHLCWADPSLVKWRTFLTCFGYCLRPAAAHALLGVFYPLKKKYLLLSIPLYVNILVFLTCFIPKLAPLTFYYDASYVFHRGPLGYTVFLVSAFYLLLCLWQSLKVFHMDPDFSSIIPMFCALMCYAVAILEAVGFLFCMLDTTILACSLFYYIYLLTKTGSKDELTGLYNRQSFFETSQNLERRITCIAGIDMNGLKAINDSKGHQAGDEALIAIAHAIQAHADTGVIPFRTGGDEFLVLFLSKGEEQVQEILSGIRADVEKAGLSVAIGTAFRTTQDASIDSLKTHADSAMYADKHHYYMSLGRDRRRS